MPQTTAPTAGQPASTPHPPLDLWPADQLPGGPNQEGLPRLTPYLVPGLVPGKDVRAAVVVCPGGGYGTRAGHEGEPVARWLNSLGLHAFLLDYRVAPHRHPLPLGDGQRALRTVRHRAAEWGVDPSRVGVLGFSAGGHLASTLATFFDSGQPSAQEPIQRQSCRPDAAILCYPVISFLQFTHTGSMHNLLGTSPTLEQRRLLSTDLQVAAQTPPTFLWHTAADAGVPVENSLLFAAALARHSIPHALHVFPTGRHGLGIGARPDLTPEERPVVAAWMRLCAEWLEALHWR